MSRIGKKPIAIPAGVEVKIDGKEVTVKGAKGTLHHTVAGAIEAKVEGSEVIVTRPNDAKENRSLHGLTRTLIANMIEGVSNGYSKALEIQGVGYRAAKQGKNLVMNLGFSHQVIVPEVDGITIDVPNPNSIVISGADKQHMDRIKHRGPDSDGKYVDEQIAMGFRRLSIIDLSDQGRICLCSPAVICSRF